MPVAPPAAARYSARAQRLLLAALPGAAPLGTGREEGEEAVIAGHRMRREEGEERVGMGGGRREGDGSEERPVVEEIEAGCCS
uniref:Uncharacterized protein n=1 Tax=Oryza sativa subsp. japonica TaxID=39947 RepID=Q6KA32_ORYSJ|nr:hypothetical protein [Oryza sativa Japonica Group]